MGSVWLTNGGARTTDKAFALPSQKQKLKERIKMKIKQKAVKVIWAEIFLLVVLLIAQVSIQFASSYRWVGFEKRDGSWASIAEAAEGQNSACQIDLAQALKDKQTAIEAANPDLK